MHALKHLGSLAVVLTSLASLAAEPVKLFPGWPALLGTGESAKAADPSIAEVSVTAKGIQVVGRKEGATTISIVRTKGAAADVVSLEVASAGWKLVPVLVATRDLAEDTVVTKEMIEQRKVPEPLLSTSQVRPDAANYILNQRLLVPVQAGDMLLWTAFESKKAK